MLAFNAVGMDAVAMSGASGTVVDPAIVTAVTVTPSSATISGGNTQQFAASVIGLNGPSQSVNWTATAGVVDGSGLFTAPATTAGHQYIAVTATSVADSSKSQSAIVTVPGTNPPPPSGIFQSRRRSARRVQHLS